MTSSAKFLRCLQSVRQNYQGLVHGQDQVRYLDPPDVLVVYLTAIIATTIFQILSNAKLSFTGELYAIIARVVLVTHHGERFVSFESRK